MQAGQTVGSDHIPEKGVLNPETYACILTVNTGRSYGGDGNIYVSF